MSELASLLEIGTPLVAGGAGLAVARAKTPRLYWSTIGLPMTAGRIAHSYAKVMEACGLTVEPSLWRTMATTAVARREIKPVPPRVRGVVPTATGLRIRLRLARGQETADVVEVTERLRHAWEVHGVHVAEVRPGIVELRLTAFDVLRTVRMPKRASAKAAGPLKVPAALREDGTVFVRDYRVIPHQLNLGANQSGKSMMLRNLLEGLAPQNVALVGIDCKWGVELAPFGPRLSALAIDPQEASELLPILIQIMEDRYALIRNRQGIAPSTPDEEITSDIWGLPAKIRPVPIVLVVDEIAELFLTASQKDEKRRDQMVTDMIRLAQLGRAAGMYMEIAGQRFGSDLGKGATALRAQLTGRVCHRVNDEASAKMALADVAGAAVYAATQIAPERPGTAVVGDTSGHWSRIRTPWRSLEAVAATCRKYADLTPDVPELARFRPVPPPAPAPAATPAPVAPVTATP